MFLPLPEGEFPVSQVADLLVVDRIAHPVPSRISVFVHVYYPTAATDKVERDIKNASDTFGESNRSGILLVFDKNPNVPCPTTDPVQAEINLCYFTGGLGEANLVVPRRITVLGGRNETTVPHFLGLALGLQRLAPNAPGFSDNLMQPAPADRGNRLTLGQVFRISTFLNSSLPRCDPGTCPPLDADVTP